jgi:hypothetical protein
LGQFPIEKLLSFVKLEDHTPAKSNQINLASLFKTVAGNLAGQKENLNNADTYNHDHGDHMMEWNWNRTHHNRDGSCLSKPG